MARDRFVTPAKGTKTRELILRMLREEGLTSAEALNAGLIRHNSSLTGIIARLEYECGFDIRVIGSQRIERRGRNMYVYRIVGRHRWNGPYRSFTETLAEAA